MSQSPAEGRRRRFGIIALVIILVLIVIILLFFIPPRRATVTLTPTSKNLSTTLNYPTDTVPPPPFTEMGTQSGSLPGTNATGSLTFQNYTFGWVTIPQGTSISTNTGQQFVTDEAAYLPPDPPSIPGTAAVSAHAANIGTAGNIPAMSFNDTPCCSSISTGITVTNVSAFSGGSDNGTVQQSNIDAIVNALVNTLTQQAQKDIPNHVKPHEQAVTSAQCSLTNATSNPGVGESAKSFTVAVSLSCSFAEYNPQEACQEALKPPPGFILVSIISCTLSKVIPGFVVILASGKYHYHFTPGQLLAFAKHIAGETKDAARTWLKNQTGVADVSPISITNPILIALFFGNNTLPNNPNVITINS